MCLQENMPGRRLRYPCSHNTVAVADDAEHLTQAGCCLLRACTVYIIIIIFGNIVRYARYYNKDCRKGEKLCERNYAQGIM